MDQYTEAYASGKHTIQGFIDGAESKRAALIDKFTSLAQAAMDAYNDTMVIESPSKAMAWSGEMTIAGLICGTESMQPEVERVMAETADMGLDAFTAENAQFVALAPELMHYLTATNAKSETAAVRSGSYGGESINITLSPTYYLDGAKNIDDVISAIEQGNDDLEERLRDILEDMGIDARRVTYR